MFPLVLLKGQEVIGIILFNGFIFLWIFDNQEETWSTIFPKNFEYQVQSETFMRDFGEKDMNPKSGSHELILQGPVC